MAAPTDYIAFYKLEYDANDETGSYNGTNNGATFDGQSAYFNGSSAYINIPSFGSTSDFSISVWYKDKGTSNYGHMFTAINQSDFAIKYFVSNKKPYFYSATTGSTLPSDDTLPQYQWHNVVVTGNSTSIKIYIDGVEKANSSSGIGLPDTNFKIGNYSSEYTKGNQANVRVYDYILTTSEITDIYNEEYEKFYPVATASISIDASAIPHRTHGTATASISVDADGIPTRPIAADADISINATASYEYSVNPSISISAMGEYEYESNAAISIDATGDAIAGYESPESFTFKYSIQNGYTGKFIFVYPIEQNPSGKIIERVNI